MFINLISFSNGNGEVDLSFDIVMECLKRLSNPDNNLRKGAEDYLSSMKYNIKLFEILFYVFKAPEIDKYFKLQAILLIKNLTRGDLNMFRMRRTTESGKEYIEFIANYFY